jgi:hypothetical protein
MIKINQVQLQSFAQSHFLFCRDWVEKSISIFENLCLWSSGQASFQYRKNQYGVCEQSILGIVNTLFKTHIDKKSTLYSKMSSKGSGTDLILDNAQCLEYIRFLKLLAPSLQDILCSEPMISYPASAVIMSSISSKFYSLIKPSLQKIFNYDLFQDKGIPYEIGGKKGRWSAYNLAENLNVTVCPYCNCNSTVTARRKNGRPLTRPEFDHFFEKQNHALLGLSFFNLVPCCHTCNHVKLSQPFHFSTNLHPHVHGLHPGDVVFKCPNSSAFVSALNGKGIIIEIDTLGAKSCFIQFKNNVEAFGLYEIYQEYTDYVAKILHQFDRYSLTYISNLANLGIHKSSELVYKEIFFDKEFDENKFCRSPLSKLTKDIASELNQVLIKSYGRGLF